MNVRRAPPACSDRLTWVRIADPTASEIALTKDSKESLAWLLSCVQSTPTKPLSDPHSQPQTLAEGEGVGIGAWHQGRSEVRDVRAAPQRRSKVHSLLRDIGLLQMAHSRLGHKYLSFAMPAGSDNTPAEAGVNKLFSTALLVSHV